MNVPGAVRFLRDPDLARIKQRERLLDGIAHLACRGGGNIGPMLERGLDRVLQVLVRHVGLVCRGVRSFAGRAAGCQPRRIWTMQASTLPAAARSTKPLTTCPKFLTTCPKSLTDVPGANRPPAASDFPGALQALFALACGVMVANVYYAQPLVALIAPELGIGEHAAGVVVTTAQLGYAAALLLITPLADLVENRRLVLSLTLVTIVALAGVALSQSSTAFLPVRLPCGRWIDRRANPRPLGDASFAGRGAPAGSSATSWRGCSAASCWRGHSPASSRRTGAGARCSGPLPA